LGEFLSATVTAIAGIASNGAAVRYGTINKYGLRSRITEDTGTKNHSRRSAGAAISGVLTVACVTGIATGGGATADRNVGECRCTGEHEDAGANRGSAVAAIATIAKDSAVGPVGGVASDHMTVFNQYVYDTGITLDDQNTCTARGSAVSAVSTGLSRFLTR
jgi:hypothetical protein